MTTTYSQKFNRFKNEVKQALEDEDDALAAYTRFVEWLIECEQEQGQSSKGDSDGDLLLVLEESIRKLREDPLCLSDRRYLKLWLMYAKRVDASEQVYSYMHANNIGIMYSPFYEEYAKCLEMKEKCVLIRIVLHVRTEYDFPKVERSKWNVSGRCKQTRARCR
jgi:checkpoint serine/threonine-protein kinase